jgi:glucose-6-phosphate 1-epimerase
MTDPCQRITTAARDGARLVGCAHGGQVLGWTPAGGTADRLWTSPLARCGPGVALRGGVPVVFPRFAARELPGGPDVPRHGFARDRAWTLEAGSQRDGTARLVATLTDSEATRALWPHRFTLTVTSTAAANRLEMAVELRNTGESPWTALLALHSYLAVSDAGTATVTGLANAQGVHNATGAPLTLPGQPFPVLGPRDVSIPGALRTGCGGHVRLSDPVLGPLTLTGDGLDDLVVWNPGPEHGLADVPASGPAGFVCLEAARLEPLTLEPAQSWSAAQHLVSG